MSEDVPIKQDPPKPSIFQKYGLNHPLLEYKTPFDKSTYSSLENILRGTYRSFVWAYGAKAAVTLIMTILKIKQVIKDPALIIKALISLDNLKFGLFGASFTGIMKSMIVLTRILRKKDDGWNGFLGGILAGWVSYFFLNTPKKTFLACFMLARAFDCYYNHLVNKGVIKKSTYHYVILFALCQGVTGYAYAHEQHLSGAGMNNFGDKMTCQTPNEMILMQLRHEMTRRKLVNEGAIKEPFLL